MRGSVRFCSQVQGKRRRIQYRNQNEPFAVGEVLCFLEGQIAANSDAFFRDQAGRFWSAEHPEEMVRDLGEWADKVNPKPYALNPTP